MVDEIFTGKIKSIETNNKDLPEIFEEKSDKEKQESDEQQIQPIFLKQRVKNLQQKEEINKEKD